LLFYPTLSTIQFSPKIFVDISRVFKAKKRALGLLTSQKDKSYMTEEYIEVFNRDPFSLLHGVKYVEKFDVGGVFL
jgi:LmbE family N-acetylglucosaminyl deacetylase